MWLGAVGDNSHPIPNDTSETFTSTANSFMMGGGDAFTVLKSASNIVQTAGSELKPLLAYVGGLPDPFTYPRTDGSLRASGIRRQPIRPGRGSTFCSGPGRRRRSNTLRVPSE